MNGSGSAQGELLFLRLFTAPSGVLPPVLFYIGFFGPLVGIALGFDAVNSERSQGTLARLLAQPIHRDAVFNGKFLAGLLTLSIVLVSMVLSIVGLGMFVMGYAPGSEEVVRLLGFSVVAVVYLAFWLALAMTLSIFFRNTVASALLALGVWLFTSFFVALLIAPAVADLIVPSVESVEEAVRHFNVNLWVARVSPSTLFDEATQDAAEPERAHARPPASGADPGAAVQPHLGGAEPPTRLAAHRRGVLDGRLPRLPLLRQVPAGGDTELAARRRAATLAPCGVPVRL